MPDDRNVEPGPGGMCYRRCSQPFRLFGWSRFLGAEVTGAAALW